MKIKITEPCIVNGEHHDAGDVVEVEDQAQASNLISSGRGEEVKPPEPREGEEGARAEGEPGAKTLPADGHGGPGDDDPKGSKKAPK